MQMQKDTNPGFEQVGPQAKMPFLQSRWHTRITSPCLKHREWVHTAVAGLSRSRFSLRFSSSREGTARPWGSLTGGCELSAKGGRRQGLSWAQLAGEEPRAEEPLGPALPQENSHKPGKQPKECPHEKSWQTAGLEILHV